jgi:hypothetical protein
MVAVVKEVPPTTVSGNKNLSGLIVISDTIARTPPPDAAIEILPAFAVRTAI